MIDISPQIGAISGFFQEKSVYLHSNQSKMDKRIYTLIFLFVIYFLIAITMLLFPTAQKFLTGVLFGAAGLGLFYMFFGLWLLERKD